MSDRRMEHDYDVAGAVIGFFGSAISGSQEDLNPVRKARRNAIPKTQAQIQDDTETGFMIIGRALREMAGQ